jgi:ribosomal protein S18 acetylase RimI-like enzyme
MSAPRGFWQRLSARLKYGQVIQEILDRLAKTGVSIYPYFVVRETPLERPELDAAGAGLEARFLETAELIEVSRIPMRPQNLARLESRLEHGNCFGIWENGRLAAYCWYSTRRVPMAAGGQPLCALPEHTVYLYDAYVRPEFRGRSVAGYMRHKLHGVLASEGARSFVSISLAFNTSTRRFKSHLGAEEIELRLLFTVARIGGFDLRLSQRDAFLATPRIKRVTYVSAGSRQ